MTPGRRKRSYRRNSCFTEAWLLVEECNTSELISDMNRFSLDPKSSWVKQQLLAYLPHSHPSESHPLGRKWRPHGGLFESIVGQWDLCNQWLLVVAIGFPKSTSQKDLLKIYTVSLSYFHLTLSIFEWILRESCKIFGNLRVLYPPNPRPPLLSLNKALFLEEGGIGGIPLGSHEKYLLWIPMGFFVGVKPLVEAHRWCHGAERFKVSGRVKNRVMRKV